MRAIFTLFTCTAVATALQHPKSFLRKPHLRGGNTEEESDERNQQPSLASHQLRGAVLRERELANVFKKKDKVDICHYDADSNQFKKISISPNALGAHIGKHGPPGKTKHKDMTVEDANKLPGSEDCKCTDGYDGDGLNCDPQTWKSYAAGTKDSLALTNLTLDGVVYETTAEVELAKSGVVSLAADESLVRSLTCYENGTVRIEMDRSISIPLESLFPTGAILIVSAEVFGPCSLFPASKVPAHTAIFPNSQDGYLRIESRAGTLQNALLSGTVVTFLSMFETVNIKAERVKFGEENDLVRRLQVTQTYEFEFPKDDPKVTLALSNKISNHGEIDLIEIEKDLGWSYKLKAAFDVSTTFEASIQFAIGAGWEIPAEGKDPLEKKLDEVTLYGVTLSILEKLAKLVKLKLPNMRAGIILKLYVGIKAEAKLEKNIGPTFKIEAATGRKEFEAYVSGAVEPQLWPPDLNVKFDYGVIPIENQKPTFTSDFSLLGEDFNKTSLELEASVFLYFKTQIALAADPLFSLDAPAKLGLEFGTKTGLPHLPPLDPPKGLDAIQFGYCNTCHFFEFSVDGKLTFEDIVITLLEGTSLEKTRALPSFDYELELALAKACLSRKYGNNTITCGKDVCCDGSYQQCQSETCIKTAPTPPPVTPPIPPPTPPPVTPPTPCSIGKVYTTDQDFNDGRLLNVNSNTQDQLQLNSGAQPFNFIWIALNGRGTVIKVDTITGDILGEYRSGPKSAGSGDPVRTAVDSDGSVWVADKVSVPGSIVHIGLQENNQCEDRNGNGIIDTSTGLHDIRAWMDESGVRGVETAEDECIVHLTRVNSTETRHLSIDGSNNVWVSGTGVRPWELVKGGRYDVPDSGKIINSYGSVGYGGFGGFQDKNGMLWSARPLLRWNTSLPLTGGNGDPEGPSIGPPKAGKNWAGQAGDSYGLCIDSMGNVWSTQNEGNLIHKYASDGTYLGGFAHGNYWAQGCVIDQRDDVWVAHSLNTYSVGHLSNNGTLLGVIDLAPESGPTGVAVDGRGKIWTSNYRSHSISRINPSLNGGVGGVDLVVKLGVGASPYNSGDMTGRNLNSPPRSGFWTVTFDSGVMGQEWGRLEWNDLTPSDSTLVVEVRSSINGTVYSPFETATKSADLSVPNGRYLQIRVLFTRATSLESPVLYDLQICY